MSNTHTPNDVYDGNRHANEQKTSSHYSSVKNKSHHHDRDDNNCNINRNYEDSKTYSRQTKHNRNESSNHSHHDNYYERRKRSRSLDRQEYNGHDKRRRSGETTLSSSQYPNHHHSNKYTGRFEDRKRRDSHIRGDNSGSTSSFRTSVNHSENYPHAKQQENNQYNIKQQTYDYSNAPETYSHNIYLNNTNGTNASNSTLDEMNAPGDLSSLQLSSTLKSLLQQTADKANDSGVLNEYNLDFPTTASMHTLLNVPQPSLAMGLEEVQESFVSRVSEEKKENRETSSPLGLNPYELSKIYASRFNTNNSKEQSSDSENESKAENDNNDGDSTEERRKLKEKVGNIVVNHLKKYFTKGKIKTKGEFKHLCRKISHKIISKESPLNHDFSENRIKKITQFIDKYISKTFEKKNKKKKNNKKESSNSGAPSNSAGSQ